MRKATGSFWAYFLVAFGLLLGVTLLSACRSDAVSCDDPLGCVVVRPNEPVQLVALLPMGGDTAVWGQETRQGIDLAIADRGNTLLNHEILLVPLDSGCDPDTAQQAVQSIDGDETVVGFIGPACSDVATAVLPTVQQNNWLMISPASSAPALTENQTELNFFRTVPNHLQQAIVAAHFAIEEVGAQQAAVFQDESSYNSLLVEQFSATFTQLGGTVTFQGTVPAGLTDLSTPLSDAAATAPDIIYMALFEPEADLLINRLAESAVLDRVVLIGGDGLYTRSFANNAGEAALGMFVTQPNLQSEAYAAFLVLWEAQFQSPPTSPTPAYAYDATQLLLTAVADIAIIEQNGMLVIGRLALQERLAATDGLPGLTGTLRCDPTGECAAPNYGVYELDTAVLSDSLWPPPLIWQFE